MISICIHISILFQFGVDVSVMVGKKIKTCTFGESLDVKLYPVQPKKQTLFFRSACLLPQKISNNPGLICLRSATSCSIEIQPPTSKSNVVKLCKIHCQSHNQINQPFVCGLLWVFTIHLSLHVSLVTSSSRLAHDYPILLFKYVQIIFHINPIISHPIPLLNTV